MGCGSSKNHLEYVDDSVHVMLQHDKKVAQKKGEDIKGYVPRAEHPLLKPKEDGPIATEEDGETKDNTPASS
jgi:hypothetical protein